MTSRHTPLLHLALVIVVALGTAGLAWAVSPDGSAPSDQIHGADASNDGTPALTTSSSPNPDIIALPDGFRPEGITAGRGSTFFVGSLADGSIYRGDFQTGEGEILVTPSEERVAVGLAYDQRSNLLFVAGQSSGELHVYDADTGDEAGTFQLTDGGEGTFINDVIVTRNGAYLTNSFQSEIYRVPLSRNGQLPEADAAETIALGGDYEAVDGFNTNGIEATPNGDFLIIVNSSTGKLYRVDPETGDAHEIDLRGDNVQAGDGLVLDGRTLYVVQNQSNQIAVVELTPDLASGEVAKTITSEHFDVPTTAASFGNDLYAVNARFGTDPTPETEYTVVRVSK